MQAVVALSNDTGGVFSFLFKCSHPQWIVNIAVYSRGWMFLERKARLEVVIPTLELSLLVLIQLSCVLVRWPPVLCKFGVQLASLQSLHLQALLDRRDSLCICRRENHIQFLQRPALGLGEEEKHARYQHRIEHRKNHICFVPQVLKRRRGDHDNEEVGYPVGAGR